MNSASLYVVFELLDEPVPAYAGEPNFLLHHRDDLGEQHVHRVADDDEAVLFNSF